MTTTDPANTMSGAAVAAPVDRPVRPAAEALHAAVCQAVALLNRAPEVGRCAEGREAHTILRQALADYADAYMDQPAPESERAAVACKHRNEPRGCYRVRCQLGRKCVEA